MSLYYKGVIRGVSFLYIRRTFKVQLIHCVWLMLTQLFGPALSNNSLCFTLVGLSWWLSVFFLPAAYSDMATRVLLFARSRFCLRRALARARGFTLASFLTRLNGANVTSSANENAKMRRRCMNWSPPSPLWNCLCCKCVPPPLLNQHVRSANLLQRVLRSIETDATLAFWCELAPFSEFVFSKCLPISKSITA